MSQTVVLRSKKSDQEFVGEIVTLSAQTKGVRIVPEAHRPTTTPAVDGRTIGRVVQIAHVLELPGKSGQRIRTFSSVRKDRNEGEPRTAIAHSARQAQTHFSFQSMNARSAAET
jgi:hypothetical protein